jgi:hypothetical protein
MKFVIFSAVLLTLLFMSSFALADSRCPDYCARGISYSTGEYNTRTGCSYETTTCTSACDSNDIACESVTNQTTNTNTNNNLVSNTTLRNQNTEQVQNAAGVTPQNRVSESNPQPSPRPLNPGSRQQTASESRDGTNSGSGALMVQEFLDTGEEISEALNAVSEYVKGFLMFWPDNFKAEYSGSEILYTNTNTKDLLDMENALIAKNGYASEKTEETLAEFFPDLFTFYLPGDTCDIVIDTCPVGDGFGHWEKYVALDSLKPKILWETPFGGMFSQNTPGECPTGFASCGEYKYVFTPNEMLAQQGLEKCDFTLKKAPTNMFDLEGEVCGNDNFAKSLEDGDGTEKVYSWNCGLLDDPLGKPICKDWENATGQLETVLPNELNLLSNCKSYKAEDISGGYHFITVRGQHSYLRYTYSCRNKGLFG